MHNITQQQHSAQTNDDRISSSNNRKVSVGLRAHDAQPLYLGVCEEDPANEIESREGGWRAAATPGHPPANDDERKEEDEMEMR